MADSWSLSKDTGKIVSKHTNQLIIAPQTLDTIAVLAVEDSFAGNHVVFELGFEDLPIYYE